MEGHPFESEPHLLILNIEASDTPTLQQAAELVSRYSWGEDYPVSPFQEIENAQYRVGAFKNKTLIGFASVGHGFSPDGIDNDAFWLAHVVVMPEYRQRGVFQKLYDAQLAYAQSRRGRILSCTDNPIVENFFSKNGWTKLRDTIDETGEPCQVFEYLTKA